MNASSYFKKSYNMYFKKDLSDSKLISETPKGLQIFSVENKKLIPHWNVINEVFLNEDVIYRPMKVLVACGLPQRGKSTICNLIYNNNSPEKHFGFNVQMTYDEIAEQEVDQTLDNSRERESQFSLQKMIKKVFEVGDATHAKTLGIWITPKPIIQNLDNGTQVNIFLVDCQGVSGAGRNIFINNVIFAMGCLMSSNFIYNVRLPVDDNDEILIKNFVSSAETISKSSKQKPFQKLFFLFRDYEKNDKYRYGSKDAKKYINYLKEEEDIHLDLSRYFDNVRHFLMPNPGPKLCKQSKNEYFLCSEFSDVFLENVQVFRSSLIDSRDYAFKLAENQSEINGFVMSEYLRHWHNCIEDGKLIEIPNAFDVCSDRINQQNVSRFEAQYIANIQNDIQEFVDNLSVRNFDENRSNLIKLKESYEHKAITSFNEKPWNGGIGSDNKNYRDVLRAKINDEFTEFDLQLTTIKDLWLKYIQKMHNFSDNCQNVIEDMISGKFKSEHKKHSKHVVKKFTDRFHRNLCYGIDMKKVLIDKMERYIEKIDINADKLKTALTEYNTTTKEAFDKSEWYTIGSNKWFELDNQYFVTIKNKLSNRIIGDNKEFDTDFNVIFEYETEAFMMNNSQQSLLKERIVCGSTGAVSLVAGIAGAVFFSPVFFVIGGVGVLAAGGYQVYSYSTKPNLNRSSSKKKE